MSSSAPGHEIVRFPSGRDDCEADLIRAETTDLRRPSGTPCVVMAHGFGATRDSGLHRFAARFAEAGCDVLIFDYRGFAGSSGEPRQDIDHGRHREDYHAAVAWMRDQPGTDPDRIALWGSSYSGGHVLAVAAEDQRTAAVISQGAAVDGLAALTGRGKVRDPEAAPVPTAPGKGRRIATDVARDLLRQATGRSPHHIAFLGDAASGAMLSGPGAEAFQRITGPTFENRMCARGILRIPFNRPIRMADRIRARTLFVVAQYDEIAPSASVLAAARRMGDRAEVVEYPCGHFAVYDEVFEDSIAKQCDFLVRVLG